jgi:hypothetical protein
MELPDVMTIGEAYGPAMTITTQVKADEYFEALVQWSVTHEHQAREDAERIIRHNLGYYAGYYDSETRTRVERLFQCAHPIFGAIGEKGQPTPEQAFEMGKVLGAKGVKDGATQ